MWVKITGFGRSRLLNNRGVEQLIAKAPEVHVSNPPLTEIVYVNRTEPEHGDMRRRPTQTMADTEINEATQTARIRIFRQKPTGNDDIFDFQDSIFHEIGHVVYYFFLTNEQKLKWHRVHTNTHFRWTEAGGDPVEHFAETYATYLLHKELVKGQLPTEYSFMEHEVFRVDQ